MDTTNKNSLNLKIGLDLLGWKIDSNVQYYWHLRKTNTAIKSINISIHEPYYYIVYMHGTIGSSLPINKNSLKDIVINCT